MPEMPQVRRRGVVHALKLPDRFRLIFCVDGVLRYRLSGVAWIIAQLGEIPSIATSWALPTFSRENVGLLLPANNTHEKTGG